MVAKVFPSYSTQPHTSLSLLWLNIPSSGPQVTWLPVPSPLRPSSWNELKLLTLQLSSQFPPKPTVQGQNHHPRHRASTSIPGTSDRIPGAAGYWSALREPASHSPTRVPFAGGGCSSLGPPPPPPPWASERGIQLLGVSLGSQSGRNFLERMAVTLAALRLPRPCPHGMRPALAALGPLYSPRLPCSGLTQTPVWDSFPHSLCLTPGPP